MKLFSMVIKGFALNLNIFLVLFFKWDQKKKFFNQISRVFGQSLRCFQMNDF
jgi:hypothetical protein